VNRRPCAEREALYHFCLAVGGPAAKIETSFLYSCAMPIVPAALEEETAEISTTVKKLEEEYGQEI
jgi:hypothetical protein